MGIPPVTYNGQRNNHRHLRGRKTLTFTPTPLPGDALGRRPGNPSSSTSSTPVTTFLVGYPPAPRHFSSRPGFVRVGIDPITGQPSPRPNTMSRMR